MSWPVGELLGGLLGDPTSGLLGEPKGGGRLLGEPTGGPESLRVGPNRA